MTRTANAKIRAMDMPVLDRVFGMEGGYVLDFSNRTFAEFFREELRVNIDHPRWAVQGESKAKRLRYYLRQANPQTALDTLGALWEYRDASSVTHDTRNSTRGYGLRSLASLNGSVAHRRHRKWLPPPPLNRGLKRRLLRRSPSACWTFPSWPHSGAAMPSRGF